MAKCIKRVLDDNTEGEIYRVSDELAERAVASMLWDYTSKGAWKSAGRVLITDRIPGMDKWVQHDGQ